MKQIIFISAIFLFTLNACGPSMDETTNNQTPSTSQPGEYSPSPADSVLMRSKAFVEEASLLTLESYPLQFSLHISGSLPTPCHNLRVAVSPPNSENKVVVDAYSVADPDVICAQVLAPFDVTIPLGSFPAGKYTLWVNDKMIAEFQS